MHEALGGQITLSAVIILVMQWAKGTKWFPFIQGNTDKLNRLLAVALSGAAAIGIHLGYDTGFSWFTGGTITVVWPGMMAVLHGGWEWLQSFAIQEWMYRSGVKSVAAVKP